MNIVNLILALIFLAYEISVLFKPKKYFEINKEQNSVADDKEKYTKHIKNNIILYRLTILYWLYLFYGVIFTSEYKYFLSILALALITPFFKNKYWITYYIDALLTIIILIFIIIAIRSK